MDKEVVVDIHNGVFSSVQLLSHVRLFVTPWIAARQASLSITNSRSSLRLTSIESVIVMENGACSKIKPNSRMRQYYNEANSWPVCDKRGVQSSWHAWYQLYCWSLVRKLTGKDLSHGYCKADLSTVAVIIGIEPFSCHFLGKSDHATLPLKTLHFPQHLKENSNSLTHGLQGTEGSSLSFLSTLPHVRFPLHWSWYPIQATQFSSVQLLSRVWLSATPWIAARQVPRPSLSRARLSATPWITPRQASLSITNYRSLPKPMSI